MDALVSRKTLIITLASRFEPDWFFDSRPGLWVSSRYRYQIVKYATSVEAGAKFKIAIFELNHDLYDEAIEMELPKDHFFDETAACTIIAKMITKQKNGEDGYLENTSKGNLMYTTSYAVFVDWDVDMWRVNVSERALGNWHPGVRVISALSSSL